MNIAKLHVLIPATFDYTYVDENEAEVTETINLQLQRMSFDASASKKFREAIKNEDEAVLKEMLSKIIASWDLDWNGDPFEPTSENIGKASADFVGKLSECIFARLNPNPQKLSTSEDSSEPLANSTAA